MDARATKVCVTNPGRISEQNVGVRNAGAATSARQRLTATFAGNGALKFASLLDNERKQRERKESAMISKTFRIARMIVLASLTFSAAAWAATCSNASLSGTYGFLHDGTESNGAPATAAVSQVTFDSTTGTFTGETTASHGGVIATAPLTGTYAVASNCTGTGNPTGGKPLLLCGCVNRVSSSSPFFGGIRPEAGLPDLHQCRS